MRARAVGRGTLLTSTTTARTGLSSTVRAAPSVSSAVGGASSSSGTSATLDTCDQDRRPRAILETAELARASRHGLTSHGTLAASPPPHTPGDGAAVIEARYLPRRGSTRRVGGRPRRTGLPATPCTDLPLPPPQDRRRRSGGGSRSRGVRRRSLGTRAR